MYDYIALNKAILVTMTPDQTNTKSSKLRVVGYPIISNGIKIKCHMPYHFFDSKSARSSRTKKHPSKTLCKKITDAQHATAIRNMIELFEKMIAPTALNTTV